MRTFRTLIVLGSLTASTLSLSAAQFLLNGSLENLNSTFVNTVGNYMALSANSSAISGWTVAPDTMNQIVWAQTPTVDNYNAAEGSFFADLSGFGQNSPNGALQQMLHGLLVGEAYAVSYHYYGTASVIKVGGSIVAFGSSSLDQQGSVPWMHAQGSFVATSSEMMFEVRNGTPNSQISFVDNFSVTGRAAVPDGGGTLGLLGVAVFVLAGYFRQRVSRDRRG